MLVHRIDTACVQTYNSRFTAPKWWNGRHARLRGVWGNPCGFKSRLRHHNLFTRHQALLRQDISLRCSRLPVVEAGVIAEECSGVNVKVSVTDDWIKWSSL